MSWGSGGRFTIGSTITLKLDAAVLRSTSSNGEICMSIRENAMHRSKGFYFVLTAGERMVDSACDFVTVQGTEYIERLEHHQGQCFLLNIVLLFHEMQTCPADILVTNRRML